MSEWNVPLIRGECLKLMGWEPSTSLNAWHPPGKKPQVQFLGNGCPDPTTSLDAALPLLAANDGTFIWLGLTEDGEEFEAQHGAWRQVNVNPALAVCLLRLQLEDRNLDDFRVKP